MFYFQFIEVSAYPMSCGRKLEIISITMPVTSTAIVFCEHPFHSLRIMPHTFENTTFSAMRMQKASVMSVGDSVRNPFPKERAKNWLYHNAPARAQNTRLFPHTSVFL